MPSTTASLSKVVASVTSLSPVFASEPPAPTHRSTLVSVTTTALAGASAVPTLTGVPCASAPYSVPSVSEKLPVPTAMPESASNDTEPCAYRSSVSSRSRLPVPAAVKSGKATPLVTANVLQSTFATTVTPSACEALFTSTATSQALNTSTLSSPTRLAFSPLTDSAR
ncbi:hypothetical protein D3C83_20160 [compost metagenome]